MSGFSDSTVCPNCGGSADLYTDHKPFDYSSITCYDCGLAISPQVSYMTLDELNDYRIDQDMEELKELPEQGEVW
jgi:transcription initiation factor TFIIIB Brf1 subunit/transcription initiation factor TFIIB